MHTNDIHFKGDFSYHNAGILERITRHNMLHAAFWNNVSFSFRGGASSSIINHRRRVRLHVFAIKRKKSFTETKRQNIDENKSSLFPQLIGCCVEVSKRYFQNDEKKRPPIWKCSTVGMSYGNQSSINGPDLRDSLSRRMVVGDLVAFEKKH